MLSTISEGAGALSRLFQLDTGQKPDVAGIMAQAQEQQIQTQISMERERQNLETTATELEKQSLTDGLTGIANRKRFDQELERRFREATEGGALAVLFMDADKFKSVNDTHGHQAGDEVLVELAKRAVEATGDAGLVCRYGGEEFAVIAPGADRIAGSKIAETIRKAIEANPFDLRNVPDCPDELPITISLGVAAIEDSARDAFPDAESLLKAADTVVYAAKKGGRNCTRVYNANKARKSAQTPANQSKAESKPAASVAGQIAPQNSAAKPTTQPGVITVLLVENDPIHLGLLKTVIAGISGVDACAVSTGEEALRMLGIGGEDAPGSGMIPGLLLCDLSLDGISGLETITQIRQSPEHKTMPIIAIGNSSDPAIASQCMEAGANAFLPKDRLAANPGAIVEQMIGFWTSVQLAA